MKPFIITTDSNSDLPDEYIKKENIPIIPQYYGFDDIVYGGELHLSPTEFYDKMRNGDMPTSMANNPEVIKEKFREILENGYDILHIAFSSALSGSCQNILVAANELMEQYPDSKIIVFDSLTVSLGETLFMFDAKRMQKEGKSIEQIYQWLIDHRSNMHVIFTVNDLHHLQKGGRISKTTAIIGSMIQMKPILSVDTEGKLNSSETIRGRKRSLSRLVELVMEKMETADYPDYCIGIVHGDCIEDAQYVKNLLSEKTGAKNVLINYVSPSIGSHAGPGALGVCYYGIAKKPQ